MTADPALEEYPADWEAPPPKPKKAKKVELPPITGDTLDEIRDPNCTRCPLHLEGAATICMSGSGPLNARIFVVGEAPGANEDREGVPFIGTAGQLLNEALSEAGIDRSEVFVTNAIRCRPAANRKPTLAEMKACKPYLDAELALVKPELVLLLGNQAMQSVLKVSGITKKRGAVVEKDGVKYLPAFHPAYVLRDPTFAPALAADLKTAKRLLDGDTKPPVTKMHLIRTPGRLRRFLRLLGAVEKPIAFDFETSTTTGRDRGGLDYWAPDWKPDTVAFAWKTGVAWVIPLEHREQDWSWDHTDLGKRVGVDGLYGGLATALDGKRLIGHAIKFDLSCLRARGITGGWAMFDTMLAAHLFDENRSNSLKPLARTYLGAEMYEDEIKYDGTDPLDKLALYNARDADYTLRLYHIFRDKLYENPKLARLFLLLLMPAVRALLDIEQWGFPVSLRRLRDRHLEIKERVAEHDALLRGYVPEERRTTANFNSPQFIGWLLYEHYGLPVLGVSPKTKQPSTDKKVLYEIRNMHPVVSLLIEYKRWYKLGSTYTLKWIERVKLAQQPRLFTSYNVARYEDPDQSGGTVTGRLSSNLQQIPRDTFIRSIITAPVGWLILDADMSQIELRVAAMVSGDRAMTEAYQQGLDLHVMTAAAITGKPPQYIEKKDRQIAKSANFGLLFGLGWKGFRDYSRINYGIEISDSQAQTIRNAFFAAYPGLIYWHQKQRRLVHGLGYVESPIGRRRRLPAINSPDKEVAASAERMAINSPVQGFASDLTLLALVLLHKRLDPEYARIFGTVHDSLLVEVREDKAEEVAAVVKEVMEHLPVKKLFGYSMPVPVVADVTLYRRSWGEIA